MDRYGRKDGWEMMRELADSKSESERRNDMCNDSATQVQWLRKQTSELRTSNNEIFEKNKELTKELEKLKRTIVHIREQKLNLSCQLGRSEKSYMKLRSEFAAKAEELANTNAQNTGLLNRIAGQTRDLHAVRSELVWLAEWCQKKFGVVVEGRICEAVAKIVDDNSAKEQIGWCNPNNGQLCCLSDKKRQPNTYGHFTQPIFRS